MKNVDIKNLVRRNVLEIKSYTSFRDSLGDVNTSGRGGLVLLDANENPYDNGVNRYPDPFQRDLKRVLAGMRGVQEENIFIGTGSDEIIDLCFRVFCIPGVDRATGFAPSFSMYGVSAQVNDVQFDTVSLNEDFSFPVDTMLARVSGNAATTAGRYKLMFVCSPNNPTGNSISREDLLRLTDGFDGIVVLDEAYIDFSSNPSMLGELADIPNLMILQTLSKAYGMAGLRLGAAYASSEIIGCFNAIKHPYNISEVAIREALRLIGRDVRKEVRLMVAERNRLADALSKIKGIQKVFPSDANFLLVRCDRTTELCKYLLDRHLLAQDKSGTKGCEGCIRLSVGTSEQNDRLIAAVTEFYGESADCVADRGSDQPLRDSILVRKTAETSISVSVNLDNADVTYISTGLGFFDHMLDQIAHHANISIRLIADGDLNVDCHHLMEDVAIVLGQAIRKALGDKRGLERYGFALPMDECEATVLLDFGGRIDFEWDVNFSAERIGDVQTEMFKHFFKSLCEAMQCNLHISAKGENNHHLAESTFKAFARALKQAIRRDSCDNSIPSSKGTL